MVNLVIYLKIKFDAKDLIKFLLIEKLIASGSIDQNNISYRMENEIFTEGFYSVITAQTKYLLFSEIVKAIEQKIGEEVPIHATPIVGSSNAFDQEIRINTNSV